MTAEELIMEIEEAWDDPEKIISIHKRAEKLSEKEKEIFRIYPYSDAFGMLYITYKEMERKGTLNDYIKNRAKQLAERKSELEKLFIKH